MKKTLRGFLRSNGVCWHNVKSFPRYVVWVMGMWWGNWRKSEPGVWRYVPKIWNLFPISVSYFVHYNSDWENVGIGWKILNHFWDFPPLYYIKKGLKDVDMVNSLDVHKAKGH